MRGNRLVWIITALLGAATPALALAASGTGNVATQIQQTATLTKGRDLAFGRVVRGATLGRVTINAQTGARTATGGALLIGSTGFSTAAFTASGVPLALMRITVSPTSIALARSGGGASMTLNTLRVSIGGGGQQTLPRNFTMPASGTRDFAIGGRLNVAANQMPGLYQGNFNITVNYQ